MNKSVLFILLIPVITGLSNSCKKDHNNQTTSENTGTFVATIDSKTWKPSKYYATYYPFWHQLYIHASDNNFTLDVGMNVDSSNLLKTYLLEGQGDNEATWKVSDSDKYFSSHDVADAGGSFELIKFDTSQKIITARLQFIGYSSNKSKRIEFISTEIKDIPYKIAPLNYNGNTASCTVVGTKTTVWHSKDIFAKVICMVSGSMKTLEVDIGSLLGPVPNDRYIGFKIPLEKGSGLFPVYPQLPPNIYCENRIHTTLYKVGNYSYFPAPGNLKITYLDANIKKLKAEFNLTYMDTVKQSTIQIVNGQINLNTWEN